VKIKWGKTMQLVATQHF